MYFRSKKTKQKITANKIKEQDITVTESKPLSTETNTAVVSSNPSSSSTCSRILKSIDPSAIQDVVKREITPQKTEANQQTQGKKIVHTQRNVNINRSLPAPICTVVPSQNMPKMSPGSANMSIFPKPVTLPLQNNSTVENCIFFPKPVNLPPKDKSIVENQNQVFIPNPKCWLNTSIGINTNLYPGGIIPASASDTAGKSEKHDNVYPPCEKQSLNYIPAVSWSNIPIYNFQTSYNTLEVARSTNRPQAPIGQPLVSNSIQNSSNNSILPAMTNEIPIFSSELLTEASEQNTKLDKYDMDVINIQTSSAPVYLGTNSNLSSFPYTQQLVFQDGKTQNVYLKSSGVHLPTNKDQVGNLNQNLLGKFSQNYHMTPSISYLGGSTRNYPPCLPPFNPPIIVGDAADSCGFKKASKPKKYTIAPNQVARKKLRLTPAQQVQNPLGGFY